MTIFLGHATALRYWRDMRAHNKYGFPITRSSAQPASACVPAEQRAVEEADTRLRLCRHGEPLHVIIAARGQRRRERDVVYHHHDGLFPRRAFAAVSGDVFLSSPELCFLQMAEELEVLDLALLGLELCGSYSMKYRHEPLGKSELHFDFEPPRGLALSWFDDGLEEDLSSDSRLKESGFYPDRQPLTSSAHLKRFVERCEGFHGVKKAREALKWVLDNSASPMESKLLLLLCLPRAKGGYGLPLPVLNERADPKTKRDWRAEKSFYKCDLSWGDGVVVEYESDLWHSGKEELEKDSVRRNDLTYMGNTVICVTAGQVYSKAKMDKVAALLRKKLGIRVNEPRYDFVARQQELRRKLLGVWR